MAYSPAQKREWYVANRVQHLAKTKERHAARRNAIRETILKYKQSHPCVDCGETDPVVLDFDHVGEKSFGICSAIPRLIPPEKVLVEIEKCEVRCANCHRRMTHKRRQG